MPGTYRDQVDNLVPPIVGEVSAYTASTTAAVVDLAAIGKTSGLVDAADVGLPDKYIALQADGGDIYVLFGPTSASLTGGAAPSPTAVGNNAAGACAVIKSGQTMNIRPTRAGSRFLSYVTASGTATLRVWRNSQ